MTATDREPAAAPPQGGAADRPAAALEPSVSLVPGSITLTPDADDTGEIDTTAGRFADGATGAGGADTGAGGSAGAGRRARPTVRATLRATVREAGSTALRAVRTNWLFAILLVLGIALRGLVLDAYRPAILYVDSVVIYLNHLPNSGMPWANNPSPDPLGYNMLLLRPVLAVGDLMSVVTIQHLLGLAMAVTIYAVLRRRGTWRWLAALATAPILLDGYQLEIEHVIMSDALFEALLCAAFAVLLWHRRPGVGTVIAAGLLLGLASTVRPVGAPLIVVLAVYVLIGARSLPMPWWAGRVGLTGLLAVGFAVPLYGYHVLTHDDQAKFQPSDVRTVTLYARVATFVDCSKLDVPVPEQVLCPAEPLGQRRTPDYYAHWYSSPLFHIRPTIGSPEGDALIDDFSARALRSQPIAAARVVLADASNLFAWSHINSANPDAPVWRWQFQNTFPVYPYDVTADTVARAGEQFGGGPPRYQPAAAALLRSYQLSVGYTPGPVLALGLLLALGAAVGIGRHRRPPARLAAFTLLFGAAGVLLAADAFEFTWRYQLPGLVLIPMAGALGLTAMCWRPARAPFPEAVDEVAIEDFVAEFGPPRFAPVVVVIAAYQEAGAIGAVLDRIPAATRDLAGENPVGVSKLVVVDGGSDGTADAAREHGAYTVVLRRNRGQGAALRLGYHLAREGGAVVIATTDADGQYDVDQLPSLLQPLREGVADFVTGSRRLGVNESRDKVRRTGVRVFATLVSILTGRRVTDTSFGFRAMRAEITAAVTLSQPQYQSSELLIGVLMRNLRVVEVPMTMRERAKGKSKKGNNLVYGLRYAGVVFSTWSRERAEAARARKTYRSRIRNLAMNMTANAPK